VWGGRRDGEREREEIAERGGGNREREIGRERGGQREREIEKEYGGETLRRRDVEAEHTTSGNASTEMHMPLSSEVGTNKTWKGQISAWS